jgi:hypothetical protein
MAQKGSTQRPDDTIKLLCNQTKMNTIKGNIGKKIYADMITVYASQPIVQITIHSYKAKVAELRSFFINISQVDIEANLRQALQSHHGQAFNAEAAAYLDLTRVPQNASPMSIS